MIDIYICDDEETARRQILEDIEKKILIEAYDMQVVSSTGDPKELLEKVCGAAQRRNIYFLDVDLKDKDYDGFLLGQEIRRIDPHGTLVYITSYQQLAFRTFKYHLEAFDYIIKDIKKQKDSIDRCMESLYQRLRDESREDAAGVYSIKIGDMIKHVQIADILFFETATKSHHVILHTKNCRMDFVGNLNDIARQMGDGFIRLHRSCLAAVDKITEVDLKHCRAKIGEYECLVSRTMKSALLKKIRER
ncbi:MAG: response regulator transcription factor [Eubacterium sp.]|nr:response regulator transcription factor [Eubacterium sp.]